MRALACLCWVRVGVESVLCAAACIAETGTRGPGQEVLAGHQSLVMSLKIQPESEYSSSAVNWAPGYSVDIKFIELFQY